MRDSTIIARDWTVWLFAVRACPPWIAMTRFEKLSIAVAIGTLALFMTKSDGSDWTIVTACERVSFNYLSGTAHFCFKCFNQPLKVNNASWAEDKDLKYMKLTQNFPEPALVAGAWAKGNRLGYTPQHLSFGVCGMSFEVQDAEISKPFVSEVSAFQLLFARL